MCVKFEYLLSFCCLTFPMFVGKQIHGPRRILIPRICRSPSSAERLKQIIPIFYRLHLRSLEDPVGLSDSETYRVNLEQWCRVWGWFVATNSLNKGIDLQSCISAGTHMLFSDNPNCEGVVESARIFSDGFPAILSIPTPYMAHLCVQSRLVMSRGKTRYTTLM